MKTGTFFLLPALALAACTGKKPSLSSGLPASSASTPIPSEVVPSPSATPTLTPTSVASQTAPSSTGSGSAEAEANTGTGASSGNVVGKSTSYGGNLSGGTCLFSTYTLPSGLYGTAFSGSAWNSAANCGACVEVWNSAGKSIKAMIVDQCPECEASHLDLFQNGFLQLGTLTEGIIATSYSFIPCGITSSMVLHNKSGASAYWFSMQVVNSNQPIASLEVSTNGGSSWTATTRKDYNFFEYQSGFGTQTVDVRVTSTTGEKIVVNGVSVAADVQTEAGKNFA